MLNLVLVSNDVKTNKTDKRKSAIFFCVCKAVLCLLSLHVHSFKLTRPSLSRAQNSTLVEF